MNWVPASYHELVMATLITNKQPLRVMVSAKLVHIYFKNNTSCSYTIEDFYRIFNESKFANLREVTRGSCKTVMLSDFLDQELQCKAFKIAQRASEIIDISTTFHENRAGFYSKKDNKYTKNFFRGR